MLDYFALLEVPRQPWLEEDAVRAQFQRLAATAHPDGLGGDNARFVALNEAWQALRSPTARLRHYLELTNPDALQSSGSMAGVNGDLFMEIAEAQQRATAIGASLAEARTPVARAILEIERIAARERLEQLMSRVSAQMDVIYRKLREEGPDAAELASALNQLVFLEKWNNQLRERMVALS
jgi:hypothetical protein